MNTALLTLMIVLAPGCKKKGDTTPVTTTPPRITETAPPVVDEPPQTVSANLERVYYDFDSSSLTSSGRSSLGSNSSVMKGHGDLKIEVQGHCDERGTTEYNMALGQRRAYSAKEYLVNQGVSPSRLTVVSYGEERPLERGGSESAWAKNRRAEFRITAGGDGMVEDTLSSSSSSSGRTRSR